MKTLFVGNRGGVLAEMLELTEVVGIGVMKGTFLERDPILEGKLYTPISSYADLKGFVAEHPDVLVVSNGLSLVIKTGDFLRNRFVNIHPSFLPDLRGIDPVLGAILFERDAGATCHEIDDGIDTGPIISRIKIPHSEDLNASLLYQLSFRAEAQVFRRAWERDFKVTNPQENADDSIYFSRKHDTRILPLSEGIESCLRVIKAFDNRNQGARFFVGDDEYVTHSGWISRNLFLDNLYGARTNFEIVMVFEDTVVIRFDDAFLLLSEVEAAGQMLVGQKISGR